MIQSIDRAITILHTVAASNSWVGVREIARRVELKVPTVQNILKTLAARGYLQFSKEFRGYRLGVATLLLAEKVDPPRRMADMVRPYLMELFEQFGETTACCAMFGGQVVFVESIVSSEPLSVIHPNRVVEHPHGMAAGLLLLAFSSREFMDTYLRKTPFPELGPNLPANAEELMSELETVRQQRYAEALNICNQGIGAIAVPVCGPDGEVALALACSAPLARFEKARRRLVRSALETSARRIETRTGATSPANLSNKTQGT